MRTLLLIGILIVFCCYEASCVPIISITSNCKSCGAEYIPVAYIGIKEHIETLGSQDISESVVNCELFAHCIEFHIGTYGYSAVNSRSLKISSVTIWRLFFFIEKWSSQSCNIICRGLSDILEITFKNECSISIDADKFMHTVLNDISSVFNNNRLSVYSHLFLANASQSVSKYSHNGSSHCGYNRKHNGKSFILPFSLIILAFVVGYVGIDKITDWGDSTSHVTLNKVIGVVGVLLMVAISLVAAILLPL